MAAKEILFNTNARNHIAHGLNALANAVKITLGPRGRNVLLEKSWGTPTITKDGVTVAKEIELENRCANLGAEMVKEVASKTSDVAGDGTTTATVLAQVIYAEGAKLVAAGVKPMEMKRGIDAAVTTVVAALKRHSKPTKDRNEIVQVGIISANGDETIGNLIADAMEKVGKQGVVTVDEAKSTETTLDFAEGMQIDRGYLSPYFVTDLERMEVVLNDAYILIHEKKLANLQELLPLLELVAKAGQPLLIITEDVASEALATLVVNKLRGTLHVCAVKAPGFGDRRKEMLEDIAVISGGQAITEDLGITLENLSLQHLGRAKTITIGKDTTTIVDGGGETANIRARVKQIQARIDDTISDYERDALQERLAKITGGVAVIRVGAATETELKEKKGRVEDALNATRAAIEEGIVPGGGVALLRTLPALAKLALLGDQQYGVNVIRRALEEPLRQMARNAGAEGGVVVNRVKKGKGAFGYNVATSEYEDLVQAGVIDPTKVVRVALQNAASVAALVLTTEALIAERSNVEGAAPGAGMNGAMESRRSSS